MSVLAHSSGIEREPEEDVANRREAVRVAILESPRVGLCGHLREMTATLWHVLRRRPVLRLDSTIRPHPRWGHGKPCQRQLYDLLNHNRETYLRQLQQFLHYREPLARIE